MSREFIEKRNQIYSQLLGDIAMKGAFDLDDHSYDSLLLAASADLARRSIIQDAIKEQNGNIIPFPGSICS